MIILKKGRLLRPFLFKLPIYLLHTMNITNWIIRLVIAVVFIGGAILKLYPIEPFELIFVDLGVANWAVAPFMARLLISFEIALGLGILLKFLNKYTLLLTAATLLFFTGYLLFTMLVLGQTENCGCFGSLIDLGPGESILKNIALLALVAWLYLKDKHSTLFASRAMLMGSLIFVASVATPFILNTVDIASSYAKHDNKIGKQFQMELLKGQQFAGAPEVNIMQGRKMICFFSVGCPVCQLAASKISVMQKRFNQQLPIVIIFLGDEKNEPDRKVFFKTSKINNIPFMYLSAQNYFTLAGMRLPSIYFVDQGKIVKHTGYRDFEPEKAEAFLTEK